MKAGARMMVRTPLVACLAVLAGCAGGGNTDGPAPARAAVEGLRGRTCRYVVPQEEMPSFRSLTRVGTGGNIALWADGLTAADTIELSVRYGDDARLEWVEAIRSTVDPERVAGLEQLVLEFLEEYQRSDWGARILLVGGDVRAVAPSVICDAERTGGSTIWSSQPGIQEQLRRFFQTRSGRFPVRVTLDAEGRVLDVRLLRSTYNRYVDQFIVDYVRNSTFDPKLHDGIGVATTMEFQLRFRRGM